MWKIIELLVVCMFSMNFALEHHGAEKIYNLAYPEYFVICPENATAELAYYFDCRRFVSCVNGERTFKECPPATLFNPKIRKCDHAHNVECLAMPKKMLSCGLISNGLYQHPHDCNKFIICSHGVTHINDCPPGTAFDSLRLICDYKSKVECCSTCVEGGGVERGGVERGGVEIYVPATEDTKYHKIDRSVDLIDIRSG